MNEEISRDELEGSIAKLKKNSAPGPDNIFTELIINAGDSLISTLLHIFNKSIEEGRIPIQWKRANVKFLKKAGKSNYNHPSSYRPISLTSVLGKTMERIITTRVECYVESENILDIEQEGFRHFRSTTNALLNLTQSILDGFNLDNFTLAVLIDFEKAYDSVWREGLLVKLHQYGIKGKIWKWIQAFLNERYSRCIVNKHEGQWCRTETGLPQGNKKHPGTVHLVLGNQPIKYNPNPKLLGVTLDEKLTFSEHINIIEKKAGKSLGILREIKGIGVSATASLEVLQVMAGVLPLDLRREEMAIRDIARLNSYSTKIPIRNKIDEWKNKETVDKFISPLGLMLQQAKNMKEETDISIDDIEPEYQFQGLQASKSPPEYWRTLGSSKNRTKEQEITGKNLILNKLNTVSPSTVVAFTDGSCQSNPGPCGAGAIRIFNNKEIELKQPVSKRGSILLAELVAIKLVLDYVSRIENKTLIEEVKIFSDSQTAIGILTLNWKIENNRSTSHEIISLIKCIQKHHGIRINFDWTPGHADVRGNEIADKLAKEAAKEANQIQKEAHITVTKQDIKTAARILVNKKWQHRWDNTASLASLSAISFPAKLNSYSTKIPIRNKIDEWKNKETVDKFISPLDLMLQQAKNMREETDISVDDIEPEYQFQGLQASKSPPEYWRTLGSSKNRTKEQEITGKNLILNKLNTVSPSTVVAFTDGSCQSNPGPCGAGAIVIFNNKEIELKQPVSKRGLILLAELVAIKLVLDYVSRIENKTLIEEVKIFSDSQSAIGILTLNWKIENHRSTSHEISSLIKSIQKHHGIKINFDWTPGHAS
ncbi:Hypothetical predicted protein, partial [Mytilus galloprovincialis]